MTNLTKRLVFDDPVLDVLRGMEWSDDGRLGTITHDQLDRPLYVALNKAIESMGGKWDRRRGGHVFATDPRPQVEGLLDSGVLEVERDGFFETPRAVVKRMLELVPVGDAKHILEPSAGLGAIARVLLEYDSIHSLHLVEKNKERAKNLTAQLSIPDSRVSVTCGDFMQFKTNNFDRIYMNPPFENLQDIDHVRHAYDLLAPGGSLVSVMGASAFFRTNRKAVEFRAWTDEVGTQNERLPEGAFKESGTGVNARLVWVTK